MYTKEHYDEDLDVICHLYHSDFDKEHKLHVLLQLLGVGFDVVTAVGAMKIFHMGRPYFLSVSQPGAAISNVASDRTSPVHSHNSCNECYRSVRYDISKAICAPRRCRNV